MSGRQMSERRACRVAGVERALVRYRSRRSDDAELRTRLRALANERRRFGYRRLQVLLRREGWAVNRKRVQRLYREERLMVRKRGGRKRALALRAPLPVPDRPNAIWSLDFIHDQMTDGRRFRVLVIVDEYTREALCVSVAAKMGSAEVLEALYPLLLKRGRPDYIRSDNGPEFAAAPFQDWLSRVGIQPIRIYPSSPWENGYNERFNGTLRREVLNAEWFATTRQAQVVINTWLRQYNHIRPHHALGMRPPVPETILEKPQIDGPDQGGWTTDVAPCSTSTWMPTTR